MELVGYRYCIIGIQSQNESKNGKTKMEKEAESRNFKKTDSLTRRIQLRIMDLFPFSLLSGFFSYTYIVVQPGIPVRL
jgi:hypothetical protein